jgi:hypothetical protein
VNPPISPTSVMVGPTCADLVSSIFGKDICSIFPHQNRWSGELENPAIKQKEALLAVYPSDAWEQRVRKMSSAQISAIYLRLKEQGKVK